MNNSFLNNSLGYELNEFSLFFDIVADGKQLDEFLNRVVKIIVVDEIDFVVVLDQQVLH